MANLLVANPNRRNAICPVPYRDAIPEHRSFEEASKVTTERDRRLFDYSRKLEKERIIKN